jgi:threonine dehydratase
MIPQAWLEQAAQRIHQYLPVTPLRYDPQLDLYLKLENHQVTGSFKARGAFSKILSLQSWELEHGLVAASAGNHGKGVALAASKVGAKATIFASEHAIPVKVQAMQALGAEVRLVPGGYGEAENAGLEYARHTGATWISPYNDLQVIAGQGSVGLELNEQLPPGIRGKVIIPVGGGGLISGIGAALTDTRPELEIVAAQSEASPYMHLLYTQGNPDGFQDLPSLADGLAGSLQVDSLTFPLVKEYVDEFILVTEADIARAIAYAWYAYHETIEGSAAVPLAAVLSGKVKEHPAVLVITGGSIQPETHSRLVQEYAAEFREARS